MKRLWIAILLTVWAGAVPADYLISSPPRFPEQQENAIYRPIAELLTRVTGERFVYRRPVGYLQYQHEMRTGKYDLVLDGPAFIDWRAQRLGHAVLARLDGELTFVVLVRQDNRRVQSLAGLVEKPVCSYPPPHLTALTLLAEYPTSAVPRLILVESFEEIYQGLTGGRCEAGVLPIGQYQGLDGEKRLLRPVFITTALPNQAFTLSPRAQRLAEPVATALLDPKNRRFLAPLLDSFKAGALVETRAREYRGMARLLKGEWGYD
jgi:hypothetical protein